MIDTARSESTNHPASLPAGTRYDERSRSARRALDALHIRSSRNNADEHEHKPSVITRLRLLLQRPTLVAPVTSIASWRFVRHSVMLIIVCAVVLSETRWELSKQALQPLQERPVLVSGGASTSFYEEDRIPVVLSAEQTPNSAAPLQVAGSSESTETFAPPLRRPLPVVDAFQAVHQLVPGETLGSVAQRYAVSLESLVWVNSLENGDPLVEGQELRIPRAPGVTHIVATGETVAGIADQLGVVPEAILAFEPNGLGTGAPLTSGQEIFVPGASPALPESLLATRGGIDGVAASTIEAAGTILSQQTNLREGPSTEYKRVVQIAAGRRVRLLGQHEDWVKVSIDGESGWLRNDLFAAPATALLELPQTADFPALPPVWAWPARGSITSGYGPRWGSFHNGVDIANRAWTPIGAARSGQVSQAGWCSGYGYCVKIDHGGGVETIYGHLIDQPIVSAGDVVGVGEIIGYMGSTYDRSGGGYSTGVHLHFTVIVNGRAVNPLTFLP